MAEVHQPVKRVVPKTFLYHLTCCYHITIFFLLSKMSQRKPGLDCDQKTGRILVAECAQELGKNKHL